MSGQGYRAAAAEAAVRGRPPLLCPLRQPRRQQRCGGWEEKASKVAAVGDLREEVSDLPAPVLPVHGEPARTPLPLWIPPCACMQLAAARQGEGLSAPGSLSPGPPLDPMWTLAGFLTPSSQVAYVQHARVTETKCGVGSALPTCSHRVSLSLAAKCLQESGPPSLLLPCHPDPQALPG